MSLRICLIVPIKLNDCFFHRYFPFANYIIRRMLVYVSRKPTSPETMLVLSRYFKVLDYYQELLFVHEHLPDFIWVNILFGHIPLLSPFLIGWPEIAFRLSGQQPGILRSSRITATG